MSQKDKDPRDWVWLLGVCGCVLRMRNEEVGELFID